MGDKDNKIKSPKRRSFLQLASLAGGIGVLSPGVLTSGENTRGYAAMQSGDKESLGDFEDGLDGWKTNGGNKLTQVTEEDIPAGVVTGQHALAIEVRGDAFPMIENKKRVKNADFQSYPHLKMHIITHAKQTDSDIVLQFRLHHGPSKGKGKQGSPGKKKVGNSPRSKDVNVEESELKTVPQLRPQEVQWDMNELPSRALKTAKRLEITWYLEDHEPRTGHRGRNIGGFDYQGLMVIDNIQLFDSPPYTPAQKLRRKRLELHREHGMIVDRTFEELSKDFERGTFVYVDGTEIQYEYELLDNGFRTTIDGEVFELEG